MFGVHYDDDKELFFAQAAKRYALDAKVFRCRAAVHVENTDDITFWSAALKHLRPDDRFHFIAGSRNEYGNETSGVTQCLKYYNHLNRNFFICIDSDFRYLLQERDFTPEHFVLQTYTYSFENHHCYAEGLSDVCERVTHIANRIFDFPWFLTAYSRILHPLFMWHLYYMRTDPQRFSKYDFNQYLKSDFGRSGDRTPRENAERMLSVLQMKVDKRLRHLERENPDADIGIVSGRMAELGLTPDTTYFFLRGHNVYDMVSALCKEVCKAMLKGAKDYRKTREAIAALYRERNNVDIELRQNIQYGAYVPIQRLEADVIKLF